MRARFVGVYRVGARQKASAVPLPSGCPHTDWLDESRYHYQLTKQDGYEDLEGRLVINWWTRPLPWHRHFKEDREVVEILPAGRSLPPFRDYLEFNLTHDELRQLFTRPEAHSEWRARLSAVGGVYLILDTVTGNQYVGSATGVEGIWGRWSSYARDGHGGNLKLQELMSGQGAVYPNAFSYSILQICPKTYAQREVLDKERVYKQKLGSLATELNDKLNGN